MKKLLALSLFSFLLFFGCNQESEITSSVNNSNNQQLKLISLPQSSSGLSVETLYTESMVINGRYGAEFTAYFSYQGGPFGQVTVESELEFDSYSFQGTVEITQTLDSEFTALKFGPSMQFNKPVKLTFKFVGLDLSNVNPKTLDFVYIDANGNMFPCDYDYIQMDASNGYIIVGNAQLNHFSRYGFVN